MAASAMEEKGELVVEAVVVRRRWRQWWLGVWVAAGAVALLPLGEGAAQAGWMLALAATIAMVLTAIHPRRGPLRVSAAGVWLGGAELLARRAIRRAFVIHYGQWVAVRLESTRGAALVVEFPGRDRAALDAAVACVDALGFGVDRRAVVFVNPLAGVRAGFSALLGAFLGLLGVCLFHDALGGLGNEYLVGLVVLSAAGLAWALRTVDLAVGADGVELRGPWGRRFFPYSRLKEVRWQPPSTLWIDHGARWPRLFTETSLVDDVAAVDGFLFALGQARTRYEARRRSTVLTELIARRGRSLDEWRAALRALVDAGSGYRAQGLTAADLAALLDDPSAEEELRVGAALVLRELSPATEVTRIRVAAEACAHAPMRVALERAAEGALDEATMKRLGRSA